MKNKNVNIVKCLIEGTRNNVFITVLNGKKVLFQSSIGNAGLKNSEKKTVFGAELLGKKIGEKLLNLNIYLVQVFLMGAWLKCEKGCLDGLVKSGVNVKEIMYIYKVAHNGVKDSKKRRK